MANTTIPSELIADDAVTSDKLASSISVAGSARIAQVALTSSSNAVAWDSVAAANAYHVTTENTTFSAPSNAVEGAIIYGRTCTRWYSLYSSLAHRCLNLLQVQHQQ